MKRLSVLIIIVFFCIESHAQLKIGAEYRYRSEYKDGLRRLSDDTTTPALVSTQRTRLNLDYLSDKLQVFLSVQDVRVWGEVRHITDVPSIALHQAYTRYKINEKMAIKLGRQMLTYDNKYLLGAKNWNNVSVAHDMALFQYDSGKTSFHAGLAFNNQSDVLFESTYDLNFYKYFGFFWLKPSFNENLSASLLNFYEAYQNDSLITKLHTRATIGSFIKYKNGSLTLELAPYYQFGESKNGNRISAYFVHFEPSVKFSKSLKISSGIDYFSGDDAINDNGVDNTFSNSYGDGHAYYGFMDYFTNILKNTKNGGLSDVFIRISYMPSEKSTLHLAFHNFRLANNILDNNSAQQVQKAADKQLGSEIDLYWKYKFYKNSTLMLGYSTMLPSKSMEILKGGDSGNSQHWIYVVVGFKPTLFVQKNN